MTKKYKCRVEYLESDSTAYIDTGVSGANNNLKIEMGFSYSKFTAYGYFFSNYESETANVTRFCLNGTDTNWGLAYINTKSQDGAIYTSNFMKDTFHTFVLTKTSVSIDGSTRTNDNPPSGTANIKNIILFNRGAGTYYEKRDIGMRCYYFRIYDADTLVRDFIPVLDLSGKPAMYDKVSEKLFYNQGTGQFKVGPYKTDNLNKKLLRKKLALMLANLKKKRPYYCECEYLENTGTTSARNWINTGIVPDTTTRWEVRVAFNNKSTGKLMGSGYANPTRFNLGIETNKFRFAFNSWFDANQNIITPDTNAHTWIMDAPSKTFTIDEYSVTSTQTFGVSTFPICLFGRCNNARGTTETTNAVVGKIYYSKIWQNGALVRDMIPVLDWDYVPCMYDRVTEQLFYNQGTGDFVAGRQIHPVEYLESTGTQYIDTDTTFQVTDEVYFKGALLTRSNDKFVLSAQPWNNNNNRYSPLGYYANKLICSFGSIPTPSSYYSPEINNSDVHTITYKNKVFTMEDTGVTYDGSNLTFGGETGKIKFFYGYNAPSVARIDAYKQWRDGELICDFIPAIDENGVGFMFDRVTHTIYDNAGTGTFKYPAREVEYLESTGTQFILTGFTPTVNTDFELELSSTKTSTNWTMGCPTWVGVHYKGADGQIGVTNSSTSDFQQYVNYARDNTRITMKLQGNTVYANGVSLGTITRRAGTLDFALFGYRDSNRGATLLFRGSIYKCIIWDNGTLVRDFIPCFKDGQAGMWDKVNNVFYPNAGTGSFTTGKIVEDEYE